MRFGKPECEHGMPGGTTTTCALCRVQAARLARLAEFEDWADPRMAAAGADR
jgi:hypothetical protein